MSDLLTLDTLKDRTRMDEIDTVLVCLVDMQGRLMGKRYHVSNFLETGHQETHCCNYLLATDLEMSTPPGFASTGWDQGYGDYVMRPDLSTLRSIPWLNGTVLVLCDVLDHHHLSPVPHAPRQVLKQQVQRAHQLGLTPKMATELEFFLFKDAPDTLRANHYRDLAPLGLYNEDYNIFQTSKEEHVMRPLRNHLFASGIPIENSKGEAETGQQELNIKYSDALDCADYHTIAKYAAKEIAWQNGHTASFLAKWHAQRAGSAAHIHTSLWSDNENAFFSNDGSYGMSDTMQHFMAGLITYTNDYTYFLAPYVNSYKRFAEGTFAPTKTTWSVDNRTSGFRLCGAKTRSIRVECRIPGSDINPYLAQAALLAAGLKGIEEKLSLVPPTLGDNYGSTEMAEIATKLTVATESLRNSNMMREAMGNEVVDHYVRAAEWEQSEFDRAVTDWEIWRGFEQA